MVSGQISITYKMINHATKQYIEVNFNLEQTPPVKGFWSVTMYNSVSYLVPNPINHYEIGGYRQGLKNNTDGSLDIYLQHHSPGKEKESNWLPSPQGSTPFNMILRMYVPDEQVLNNITITYTSTCLFGFNCVTILLSFPSEDQGTALLECVLQ